jgi:hypothetical protein
MLLELLAYLGQLFYSTATEVSMTSWCYILQGVLEAVRISCAGFPSKRPFSDFVDHFWTLAPTLIHSDLDDREISRKILDKAGITGYQIGETKVSLLRRLQMRGCSHANMMHTTK